MSVKQLPQYQSHKVVRAAKIIDYSRAPDSDVATVTLDGGATAVLPVSRFGEHAPTEGYFVVYEDGYESFSPADAFEKGYSRVGAPEPYVPAPGHQYPLAGGQILQFLDKRSGETPDAPLVLAREGTTNEEVIDVVIDRLTKLNAPPFNCRENALAITKLEEAKHWLDARRARREKAGVYGTATP